MSLNFYCMSELQIRSRSFFYMRVCAFLPLKKPDPTETQQEDHRMTTALVVVPPFWPGFCPNPTTDQIPLPAVHC